jgi:hypothetical protein
MQNNLDVNLTTGVADSQNVYSVEYNHSQKYARVKVSKPDGNAEYVWLSGYAGPKWANYDDLATNTTPFTLTPNQFNALPNDTLGAETTEEFKPPFISNSLWDVANKKIILSEFPIGSILLIRTDFHVTPSQSNEFVDAELYCPAYGGFQLHFLNANLGNKSNEHHFVHTSMFYVGDQTIANAGLQVRVKTSHTATARVNGFLISIV